MLQDDTLSLETYVKEKNDKCVSSDGGGRHQMYPCFQTKVYHLFHSALVRNIYKWWAQYLESQSDMDAALHFYNLAEDYFSLVRVYCYMEDIQKVRSVTGCWLPHI